MLDQKHFWTFYKCYADEGVVWTVEYWQNLILFFDHRFK